MSVSIGFANKIIKEVEENGDAGALTLSPEDKLVLEQTYLRNPKSTRNDYQQTLKQATGTSISKSSLSRWIRERLPILTLQRQEHTALAQSININSSSLSATWIAPIMLKVNASPTSEEIVTIDLAKTLGELRAGQYRNTREHMLQGAYWLPTDVQGQEGVRQVLREAYKLAEFDLVADRTTSTPCKIGL